MSWTAGKSPAFFQVSSMAVAVAAMVAIAGCLGHGALTAASHNARLHAALALPPVGAPGFPAQVYPASRGHRVLNLVGQCPNPSGLQHPGPRMATTALTVVNSLGRSFRSDLRLSDRVYWQQTLIDWRGGYAQLGGKISAHAHGARTIPLLYSGPLDSYHQAFGPPDMSHMIRAGCGARTAADTWMIVAGPLNSPGIQGEYLLLDRRGHVLVWNAQ
jgi:hypothetical protein